MRLLWKTEGGGFSCKKFKEIPPYAILSHTWGDDKDEVTFADLENQTYARKAGLVKLQFCAKTVATRNLKYFWIDTCCIDKRDPIEVQRSINSMFRWYQQAAECYVLLSDVNTKPAGLSNPTSPIPDLSRMRISRVPGDRHSPRSEPWRVDFRRSRWFTRGWTLQELLAPASVQFYSAQHDWLGNKLSLLQEIMEITGIPEDAMRGHPLSNFAVEERMAWARPRQTTEEEDGAYCLLGIFGVFLPLIYGEGKQNALKRLQKEVNEAMRQAESMSQETQRPVSSNDLTRRLQCLFECGRSFRDFDSLHQHLRFYHEDDKPISPMSYRPWQPFDITNPQNPNHSPSYQFDLLATSGISVPDLSLHTPARNTRKTPTFLTEEELKTSSLCKEAMILEGHDSSVWCVAFHPGGKLIASGSDDTTILLWDSMKGKLLDTLRTHTRSVSCVQFSSDGRLLASGSFDATAIIWASPAISGSTKHYSFYRELQGHTSAITSLSFSPSGHEIVTASHDCTVKVWNPLTGVCLLNLERYKPRVTTVAFSSTPGLFAFARADTSVTLYDWNKSPRDTDLSNHHAEEVTAVAFSPDGRILASASADKTIRLWNTVIKKTYADLEGHTSGVKAIAFSSDSKLIASASADKTVIVWDIASRTALDKLSHTKMVTDVAFSTDSKRLASSSYDGRVIVWNLGAPPNTPRDPSTPPHRRVMAIRERFLGDQRSLFALGRQNKELAAAIRDPFEFLRLWACYLDWRKKTPTKKILESDAFGSLAQSHEDQLRRAAIEVNLQQGLAHNRSIVLSRTKMLRVAVRINNCPLTAFITMAQTSIISRHAATLCGVEDLIDERFAGNARGVGSGRVYGRVHQVELELASEVVNCALSILDTGEQMLFGLDLMKRLDVCIDLVNEELRFPWGALPFLPE